jgi:hypothetical protein
MPAESTYKATFVMQEGGESRPVTIETIDIPGPPFGVRRMVFLQVGDASPIVLDSRGAHRIAACLHAAAWTVP